MKIRVFFGMVATAWILLAPSAMLAQEHPRDRACRTGNPPFCNVRSVPEIDVASGLAALAAMGAGLALVCERRRRRP